MVLDNYEEIREKFKNETEFKDRTIYLPPGVEDEIDLWNLEYSSGGSIDFSIEFPHSSIYNRIKEDIRDIKNSLAEIEDSNDLERINQSIEEDTSRWNDNWKELYSGEKTEIITAHLRSLKSAYRTSREDCGHVEPDYSFKLPNVTEFSKLSKGENKNRRLVKPFKDLESEEVKSEGICVKIAQAP